MNDIPIFRLYGEHHDGLQPDLLHLESIASRSSQHNWHIRPHRHSNLYQILYIHCGQAELEIEGEHYLIDQPCMQWLPPLCIHGFQFSRNVQGWILTLAPVLVERTGQAMYQALSPCSPPLSLSNHEQQHISLLFTALTAEYTSRQPGRQAALDAWISLLLVWLQRRHVQEAHRRQSPLKGYDYFQRYCTLIEQQYRQQWSVAKYASALGISMVRLNQLCRQLVRQSAQQYLHQRLLLEAKRELLYTTLTITQISDGLGFSEPAYFSRFFRRLAGCSPNQFRQRRSEAVNRR